MQKLVGAAQTAPSDGVALPGEVLHSEFLGASVRYAVAVGGNAILIDVAHQAGDVLLAPGALVRVVIDHERCCSSPVSPASRCPQPVALRRSHPLSRRGSSA